MLNRTIEHITPIAPSELIITEEGKIYHLNLHPNDIAYDIIVVGDQNRVKRISQHFDSIEIEVENREFVTHTGMFNGKRLTVLSTGIGCDNIDIVINELDALVNIDFHLKTTKKEHTQLNIIRLGTSGSLQADIPVDSFVVSEYGLGFDGLAGFYDGIFEKDELKIILDLYAKMVSEGSWKDYGLSISSKQVGFSVFKNAAENALYKICKNFKPKNKNLKYLITDTNAKILKNSFDLNILLKNTNWKKL